jgi:Dehydrogenases (flavoproteins)
VGVFSWRVHGIRVLFPVGTDKRLSEEGYVLEKPLFERWITDEAVSAGAPLNLGPQLLSMERADGEPFSGWVCEEEGDQFPILARIS